MRESKWGASGKDKTRHNVLTTQLNRGLEFLQADMALSQAGDKTKNGVCKETIQECTKGSLLERKSSGYLSASL